MDIQVGAEWTLYDAEVAFIGLPPGIQAEYLGKLTTARATFMTADVAFVDAVNAVIAAKQQDYGTATADLTAAVDAFLAAISPWYPLSSSSSQSAAKSAAEDLPKRVAKIKAARPAH